MLQSGEACIRNDFYSCTIKYFLKTSYLNTDSFSYPVEELKRLWKLLLLNQFHDVIPGSCINEASDQIKMHCRPITS
jgi:alpha-mannosidase